MEKFLPVLLQDAASQGQFLLRAEVFQKRTVKAGLPGIVDGLLEGGIFLFLTKLAEGIILPFLDGLLGISGLPVGGQGVVVYTGSTFAAQVLADDFSDGILQDLGKGAGTGGLPGIYLAFDGHDCGQQSGDFLIPGGNVRIPEQILIGGQGDAQIARVAIPSLITLHYSYEKSGEIAVQMLMEALAEKGTQQASKEMKLGYHIVEA